MLYGGVSGIAAFMAGDSTGLGSLLLELTNLLSTWCLNVGHTGFSCIMPVTSDCRDFGASGEDLKLCEM